MQARAWGDDEAGNALAGCANVGLVWRGVWAETGWEAWRGRERRVLGPFGLDEASS